MRKNFVRLSLVFFGLLTLAGIYIAHSISQQQLSTQDSSALFGGELEDGYPAAGYMLSYRNGSLQDLCGAVVISESRAVTAAHCLDTGTDYYFDTGEFDVNEAQQLKVNRGTQKPGWDKRTSDNDIAFIDFAPQPFPAEDIAKVANPQQQCGYRVVAYGRNETEAGSLTLTRPRKSAEICISEIFPNTFTLTSGSGGICVGDSGSPIFEEFTNNIVGVISAVKKNNAGSDPCYIGNIGIAVRLDVNQPFTGNLDVAVPQGSFLDTISSQLTQFTSGEFDLQQTLKSVDPKMVLLVLIVLVAVWLVTQLFKNPASSQNVDSLGAPVALPVGASPGQQQHAQETVSVASMPPQK